MTRARLLFYSVLLAALCAASASARPVNKHRFATMRWGLAFFHLLQGASAFTLFAFLVYDLVLIPRYAKHFERVAPAHLTSLRVHMAVMVFSSIVAICYLIRRCADAAVGDKVRSMKSGMAPGRELFYDNLPVSAGAQGGLL